MKGHTTYVSIFIGCCIGPIEGFPGLVMTDNASNPIKTGVVVENGRRRTVEYFWNLGAPDNPLYMDVVAYKLSPDQELIADRIAASVKPKPLP